MVCDNAPEVYVNAVLEISVHVVNGETELCHFKTVPTFPVKVSNPLVFPVQIDVPPVTVPDRVVADATVTVVAAEFKIAQIPLCTTALN